MAVKSSHRPPRPAQYALEPGDGYAITTSAPRANAGVAYVAGVGAVPAGVHVPAVGGALPATTAPASSAGTTLVAGIAPGAGTANDPDGLPTAGAALTPALRPSALPTPTTGGLPSVAPLHTLRSADAVVMLRSSLTPTEAAKVAHLNGIVAFDAVDTGTVNLAGAPVVTFGVDPETFREFTPAASATSNRLWQYVAAGSLVSSYDMATDRNLKLGGEDPIVTPGQAKPISGWIGAFASIGLPGVDLLVDHAYSADLGLVPDTGLVISAPDASGLQLLTELESALPGSTVELLHPDQVADLISGNGLNSTQIAAVIAAALSRVGDPYVWGGAGPSSFDCSGLVQWSFARAGILMPRTAAEQFLTGVHLPLADAAPGDLLFWTYDPSDPSFVDHTAIYLGNGLMVVAPHTGLDVEVVPVPTADFAGAVQVLLRSA